jgi:hypothetical protein
MPTTTTARNRRIGTLCALAAALLLATTTGCRPGGPDTAGNATDPSAAPSTSASTDPSTSAAPACVDDPAGTDLRLYGHRIDQDIIYVTAEEGSWSCGSPDSSLWDASGDKKEIRLAESAEILVNSPFYNTAVNKPIDVQQFLDQLDPAAKGEGNLLVFDYKLGDGGNAIIKLDQRRKG